MKNKHRRFGLKVEDRRNLREGLRGLEYRITRAIDAWHLKRLGELMQVTVKTG